MTAKVDDPKVKVEVSGAEQLKRIDDHFEGDISVTISGADYIPRITIAIPVSERTLRTGAEAEALEKLLPDLGRIGEAVQKKLSEIIRSKL